MAEAEDIEVTDDEVEQEIVDLARQTKKNPNAVRKQLENEDQLPAVRSGIRKTKALEWLIAHTELVDEEGQVIDRSQLTPAEFRRHPRSLPRPQAEETTE